MEAISQTNEKISQGTTRTPRGIIEEDMTHNIPYRLKHMYPISLGTDPNSL